MTETKTDIMPECLSNYKDLNRYDKQFIEKIFSQRMAELGIISIDTYCKLFMKNPKEKENFYKALNNNYSSFFRNRFTYSFLESIITTNIINKKVKSPNKELRIWSMASALGQEPYTIALILEEIKSSFQLNFDYRIFATDISESNIEKAKNGIYYDNDISNMTYERLKKYFIHKENLYEISNDLKKNIEFSVFDLFNENFYCPPSSIFGDFDIIICSNILFYYQDQYKNIIIKKIEKSLNNSGYIITDTAERDVLLKNKFFEIYPHSCIFKK